MPARSVHDPAPLLEFAPGRPHMTRMRKSRYVSLLLAGAAATSIAACDQPGADATLYGDASSCARDFDVAACESAMLAAKQEHAKLAPKFASVAECEAAGFSACEPAPAAATDAATDATGAATGTASGGSSGSFMPIMMGYMMGRMMSGPATMPGAPSSGAPSSGTPSTGSGAKAAWNGTTRPVYANRDGYLLAGGNAVGRIAPGATSLGTAGMPARTVARGGFGGSAARMGGGS